MLLPWLLLLPLLLLQLLKACRQMGRLMLSLLLLLLWLHLRWARPTAETTGCPMAHLCRRTRREHGHVGWV